jgi:hypothetical protein
MPPNPRLAVARQGAIQGAVLLKNLEKRLPLEPFAAKLYEGCSTRSCIGIFI